METAPGKPPGVSAISANGKVQPTWAPVSGALSYNLYRNTTGSVAKQNAKISNVASPYLHEGLRDGTTYFYRLTAVGAAGEGPFSAEVFTATADETSATSGTPLSFSNITSGGMTLSWGAASDNVSQSEFIDYRVVSGEIACIAMEQQDC